MNDFQLIKKLQIQEILLNNFITPTNIKLYINIYIIQMLTIDKSHQNQIQQQNKSLNKNIKLPKINNNNQQKRKYSRPSKLNLQPSSAISNNHGLFPHIQFKKIHQIAQSPNIINNHSQQKQQIQKIKNPNHQENQNKINYNIKLHKLQDIQQQSLHDITQNNQSQLSILNQPQSQHLDNEGQLLTSKTLQGNGVQSEFSPIKRRQTTSLQNISDQQFEQKIIQNKEIVKKQVQKRLSDNKTNNKSDNKNLKDQNKNFKKAVDKNKKHPPLPKNQSLYQKRVRQYKQISENKYLNDIKKQIFIKQNKSKQLVKSNHHQKPKKIISIKQSNSNDKNFNNPKSKEPINNAVNRYSPNIYSPKKKNRNQKNPYSPHLKMYTKEKTLQKEDQILFNHFQPSQNLFQDLQNLLQHPHKSRSQLISLNKMIKDKKLFKQKIQQLQKKQKLLASKQKKLNYSKQQIHIDQQSIQQNVSKDLRGIANTETLIPQSGTIKKPLNIFSWQRIILKNNEVQYKDSNFDGQVQRINSLLSNNQRALQNYLKNQLQLLDIQLQNKIQKSDTTTITINKSGPSTLTTHDNNN